MLPKRTFFWLLVRAWLMYPLVALWSRRARGRIAHPQAILVVPQANRIGDLMCATPVFRALRRHLPEARLCVLVSRSKGFWHILEDNPDIDEFFFYEDGGLVAALRARHFAWSLNLTNNPIPSVLAFLAVVPVRVKTVVAARSRSEVLTDFLNTHRIEYRHHTHLPTHYLRLLEPMGIRNPSPDLVAVVTAESRARVAPLLPAGTLVGISVTAGNKIKEWPTERFAALADRILDAYPVQVVFIGGQNDARRIDEVRGLMRRAADTAVVVAVAVRDLPALMERLSCFVAVDTGPIYIAHALGVPLVDIVGPCDPAEQPPHTGKSVCVLPPLPIKPSSFVMMAPGAPHEHQAALEAITTDAVYAAFSSLYNKVYTSA
jgi:ADP-heptose:LPS heptosyltransferase